MGGLNSVEDSSRNRDRCVTSLLPNTSGGEAVRGKVNLDPYWRPRRHGLEPVRLSPRFLLASQCPTAHGIAVTVSNQAPEHSPSWTRKPSDPGCARRKPAVVAWHEHSPESDPGPLHTHRPSRQAGRTGPRDGAVGSDVGKYLRARQPGVLLRRPGIPTPLVSRPVVDGQGCHAKHGRGNCNRRRPPASTT